MVKLMIMRRSPSSGGFIKSEIKKRHMHPSSMNFVKIVPSIAVLSMAMSKEGIHRPSGRPIVDWTFVDPSKVMVIIQVMNSMLVYLLNDLHQAGILSRLMANGKLLILRWEFELVL